MQSRNGRVMISKRGPVKEIVANRMLLDFLCLKENDKFMGNIKANVSRGTVEYACPAATFHK